MKSRTIKRKLSKKRQAHRSQNAKSEIEITKELCKSIREKREKKPVSNSNRKPANSSKKQIVISKHGSICPTKAMRAQVKRDKNGRILPGSGSNAGGRPTGAFSGIGVAKFRNNELKQALLEFELEHLKAKSGKGKKNYSNWLKFQIKKSFDDTALAVTIMRMLFPSLKSIEQITNPMDAIDMSEAEAIRREVQDRLQLIKGVEK